MWPGPYLLLVRQIETPVSSMKVAVQRRSPRLWECGLARFPFWAARIGGRTAVNILLSDCQYRKGTALYGRSGVWNTADGWGGCGLSWAWTLSLVPAWWKGSRGQPSTRASWNNGLYRSEPHHSRRVLSRANEANNAPGTSSSQGLETLAVWSLPA